MATEYGGYMGKILLIDLANETFEEYPFPDRSVKKPRAEKELPSLPKKQLAVENESREFQEVLQPRFSVNHIDK